MANDSFVDDKGNSHPIYRVGGDGIPFSFGISKAKRIVAEINAIQNWLTKVDVVAKPKTSKSAKSAKSAKSVQPQVNAEAIMALKALLGL
jgi:hypothetical protein